MKRASAWLQSVWLCHLLFRCEGLQAYALQPTVALQRAGPMTMMGRAEKRMAKKRAKKGAQFEGGRALRAPSASRDDKLPKRVVCERLAEVPVFGVRVGANSPRTETGFAADADGVATIYMAFSDAEAACNGLPAECSARVVGMPLDEVFFDPSHLLKPSASAITEARRVPTANQLVAEAEVRTPLFCIDGMQVDNKETGVSSLPMFFSRAELLEFATPVYGKADAESRVLLTDLGVVVGNMANGPAGLLRKAKFFAAAPELSAMDRLEAAKKSDLFGTTGSLDAQLEQGAFGGIKLPWM